MSDSKKRARMAPKVLAAVTALALAAGGTVAETAAGKGITTGKYYCGILDSKLTVKKNGKYVADGDKGKYRLKGASKIVFKSGPFEKYKGTYGADEFSSFIELEKKGKFADTCLGPGT